MQRSITGARKDGRPEYNIPSDTTCVIVMGEKCIGIPNPRVALSNAPVIRSATLTSMLNCSGLRLVKRTVNFDDPSSYHFYFGDAVGTPGSERKKWKRNGKGYTKIDVRFLEGCAALFEPLKVRFPEQAKSEDVF